MTTSFYEIASDGMPPENCNHRYCNQIATTSLWGWQKKKLVLKGQWCRNHDRWWKRIELPEISKDVRNHLFATLFLVGSVTLAIKCLPVFLTTLAVALGITFLAAIYVLIWVTFDCL
jgi:hypothetical protein